MPPVFMQKQWKCNIYLNWQQIRSAPKVSAMKQLRS